MPTLDPAKLSDTDYRRWERVQWLRALIAGYRDLYARADDDDPDATTECLRECEALADELEAQLPATPAAAGVFVKCVECGHPFETSNPDAGHLGMICPDCFKAAS